MHVGVQKLLEDGTESEPKVIAAESQGKDLKPLEVIFEEAAEGTEYVFSGDHLCWLNRHQKYIGAIDLTKENEERKTKKISFS